MQPPETPVQPAKIPDSEPASVAHRLALALILIADIAVRLHCLACKPFWFDEAFSVEVARIDWRNFLHLLWWREANMSLYYVLLRIWLHFGHSPFFIRSLSVVISAGSLLAVYGLARLLFDRRVALISAALLAFNAYDVRYAQEARSYALLVCLATLSSGFFIAWLRTPTRRSGRAYVLTSTLAVYAHFYALLLVAAHWLALRWAGSPCSDHAPSETNRSLRRAWIAIGVLVSPLLIFVAKTGAGPIRWITRPDAKTMLEFFEHLAGGSHWPLLVVYGAGCLAALAVIGKRLWRSNQGWEVWRCQFLLIWFLFPAALTFVLSFARPVFLARYMIFCLPAFVVLAAAGLARLRRWWVLPALAVVVLLGWQGISFVYNHDFDTERDASGAATDFILEQAQPGDAILFHIAETRVPYEFFRSLRARENTASPKYSSQLGPEILFPRHGPGLDYRDFTGKPTAEFLHDALADHPRVWVMLMNNGTADKPDPTTVMLTQLLPKTFPKLQQRQFAKVEVRLYSKP